MWNLKVGEMLSKEIRNGSSRFLKPIHRNRKSNGRFYSHTYNGNCLENRRKDDRVPPLAWTTPLNLEDHPRMDVSG